MGAWGYEPLDSDAALDWLDEYVSEPVGENVAQLIISAKGRERQYAEELRAAAQVVLQINFFRHQVDLHGELAEMLTVLRDDSDYLDEWNEPGELKASLDKHIQALRDGPRSTTLLSNLLDKTS
jgi:hypothetical protein